MGLSKGVRHMANDGVEVQTDLATYLVTLADRLRATGWALDGRAALEGDQNDPEARVLHELSAGLDRSAEALEAVRRCLCDRCRMVEVVERRPLVGGAVPSRKR